MGKNKVEIVAEPGKPTMIMRRTFNAPRALVFEAHHNPELLKKWWGPRSIELIVCEVDFRVGGTWRFVQLSAGKEHGFHGEFKEIVVNEKISQTFIYDPFPNAVAFQTMTLEEKNGVTVLTTEAIYDSVQSRDGHIQSGMEWGMNESCDRLDEALAVAKSA
jgi:uncharacterized protein YndB with AHSA1/START domain